MNNAPVYFLVRNYHDHFTCYARGISILSVPELSKYSILRFYPQPSEDLTPRIAWLQRRWRERRTYRKWCAHPNQLFYRETYGRFPSKRAIGL